MDANPLSHQTIPSDSEDERGSTPSLESVPPSTGSTQRSASSISQHGTQPEHSADDQPDDSPDSQRRNFIQLYLGDILAPELLSVEDLMAVPHRNKQRGEKMIETYREKGEIKNQSLMLVFCEGLNEGWKAAPMAGPLRSVHSRVPWKIWNRSCERVSSRRPIQVLDPMISKLGFGETMSRRFTPC